MNDLVPADDRIDRPALERIIQRAAELQAGEHEVGEGLSEGDLLKLGEDVGIPARYLQQALLEERTRALAVPDRGMARWLAGPRIVTVQRVMAGTAAALDPALHHWMETGELLVVKRRYPDRITWEARRGTMASIKRSFGSGGRKYELARAHEVSTQVIAVDPARCHVRLVADLSNTRREHLAGAGGMAVTGAGMSAVGLTLGVAAPVALMATVLGVAVGYAVGRNRRRGLERMHVALEQVLDRLEHGDIQVPAPEPPRLGPLERLAAEVRRAIEPHVGRYDD